MPVWHEATREAVEVGDLAVAGIVQEQHPDRARLFMQWQQMDWPIMVDPLNLLGVSVVPIHVFIDEFGLVHSIVRARSVDDMKQALQSFLEQPATDPAPPDQREAEQGESDAIASILRAGDQAVLRAVTGSNTPQLDLARAIENYTMVLLRRPDHHIAHFRLGVAYRMRYDSPHRRAGDFAKAIEHWQAARDGDPNQYIWRRRIQQYGPRLDKPYSFYDWVNEARTAIVERGESPVALRVEPGGAEFAYPSRDFTDADADEVDGDSGGPDPDGRIHADEGFIGAEFVQVDHTDDRRAAIRMHIVLMPNSDDAYWNNEAEPLTIWLDPPDGWQVNTRQIRADNPTDAATSREPRHLEFELLPPEDVAAGMYEVKGYALYNVCRGAEGVCLYRRKDLKIPIAIEPR